MVSTTPRPALGKAPDAGLHPVSGRPLGSGSPGHGGKSLKAGKGATAADAITGPAKDKYVDLGVRVPKSVRKRLRAQAKATGVTPDDLVSRLLASALGTGR